jgi:hypothetical protein
MRLNRTAGASAAHRMQIDHHTVLNAITRSIILCDSNPEEAKEGLYALGDYFKHYFAAAARSQTAPSEQDLERIRDSLAQLRRFLQSPPQA